jgi:curli biogenesis system outer membrane secretion channel CsgG
MSSAHRLAIPVGGGYDKPAGAIVRTWRGPDLFSEEGIMRKRTVGYGLASFAVAVILMLAAVPTAPAAQKSIAVMKFTTTAGGGRSYWYSASWDLGEGMAEMTTTALLGTGRFRVLERQQINDVIGEQDFGDSGRVDPATAAKIGKILGAQYLLYGTVNEFEYSKGGEAGGVRIGGLRVGAGAARAHVGMDVRVVDAVTGEILFSTRSTANASRTGFKVGYSGSDFGANLGAFQKTPLGEATRKAIEDAVAKLARDFGGEAPAAPPVAWTGKLIIAEDGALVIKAGTKDGLKVGDVLTVFRPKTVQAGGETLVVGEDEIGKIRLTMVGESAASAEVVTGQGFKTGDVVKSGGN